jgi:hypothetical protein
MRIKLILALLVLPVCALAQKSFNIQGRIINEKGEAVEYVQVGIPKLNIGTVSTVDGHFKINVPVDTLEFHHVSYQATRVPVTGEADDLVIVLQELELPPVVLTAGETKEKYLVRPGKNILGSKGSISISLATREFKGGELGSVARTKKKFKIKDIELTFRDNSIPDCVASINIYLIEDRQKETFVNVLNKPIYFNVPVSKTPQKLVIHPSETVMLEPGKYFIAFQIVGCNKEALEAYLAKPEKDRLINEMKMTTAIYLKSSYLRENALGKMQHIPINIGIAVKGLEYQ